MNATTGRAVKARRGHQKYRLDVEDQKDRVEIILRPELQRLCNDSMRTRKSHFLPSPVWAAEESAQSRRAPGAWRNTKGDPAEDDDEEI